MPERTNSRAEPLPVRALVGVLRQTAWRIPMRARRRLLRLRGVRTAESAFYRRIGTRVVAERRHGFSMQVDLSNFDHRAHFRVPHVERRVVEYIAQSLQEGDVAFDVGSFCGYYALLMSRRVGDSGTVVAFEPSPENAGWVETNLRLNELRNVRLERLAVSDASGRQQFAPSGPVSKLSPDGGALSVDVVSLDDYIGSHGLTRLDLVKVDVEGFEHEVIVGMTRTLSALKPRLVIEVNDAEQERVITHELRERGYSTRLLGRAGHGTHLLATPDR